MKEMELLKAYNKFSKLNELEDVSPIADIGTETIIALRCIWRTQHCSNRWSYKDLTGESYAVKLLLSPIQSWDCSENLWLSWGEEWPLLVLRQAQNHHHLLSFDLCFFSLLSHTPQPPPF